MISCRVSRREYKAQQGKLSVHLPAVRPLLRLHFQVVFSWPRREWARGRRRARSEWHRRVLPGDQRGQLPSKAAEAGDLQGWRRDRSGEVKCPTKHHGRWRNGPGHVIGLVHDSSASAWPRHSVECCWWKCRWGFKIHACHMSCASWGHSIAESS